jgi:hypothetical protein
MNDCINRSQWPERSKAGVCGRLLARISGSNPAESMDVCLVSVVSGWGLCDGPTPRREESYGLWCVVVCDLVQQQSFALAVGMQVEIYIQSQPSI